MDGKRLGRWILVLLLVFAFQNTFFNTLTTALYTLEQEISGFADIPPVSSRHLIPAVHFVQNGFANARLFVIRRLYFTAKVYVSNLISDLSSVPADSQPKPAAQPKEPVAAAPSVPAAAALPAKTAEFVSYWTGTRYVYGGNSKSGIDCSALTQRYYSEILGIAIPRSSYMQYQNSIKTDTLTPGTLIFFHSRTGHRVSHVALYLGSERMVHARSDTGVTFEILNDYWKNLVVGYGVYK